MSLFEDLVDELKEDNLLEETIIDSVPKELSKEKTLNSDVAPPSTESGKVNSAHGSESATVDEKPTEGADSVKSEDSSEATFASKNEANTEKVVDLPTVATMPTIDSAVKPVSTNAGDDKDFYRRRALDEVNGLEMVEHVLSGVEREQMKTAPKPYEDFEVKQALHEFLKVAENVKSADHAQAEFRLMQETEDWYSALSRRDRNISVSHLRLYCETTKPSLSSQALISLARFYRNSPYSEDVRSKFDLIVTKLFTKDLGNDQRELVFKADELVEHVQELYAEWSSVPLYSTEEEDSGLLLTALKFQDFINEAENAESFDELVKKDFFKRLKVTKEKSNENFFAPLVVSAAVESNVVVGNRYVELIQQDKEDTESGDLSDKYGVLHDKAISESTSKTLELVEILKEKNPIDSLDSVTKELEKGEEKKEAKIVNQDSKTSAKKSSLFGANIWLVIATAAVIALAILYFAFGTGSSTKTSGSENISSDVKIVNLENSTLKEYLQMARIKGNTLFGITNDSWSEKSYKEREEVVEKILSTSEEKGFKKAHLIDSQGVTVAFGDEDGVNIVD